MRSRNFNRLASFNWIVELSEEHWQISVVSAVLRAPCEFSFSPDHTWRALQVVSDHKSDQRDKDDIAHAERPTLRAESGALRDVETFMQRALDTFRKKISKTTETGQPSWKPDAKTSECKNLYRCQGKQR